MPFNYIIIKVTTAVLLACALGGCTATTPTQTPGSQASDSSGVTVFGTVDVGVGRTQ